MKQEARRKVQLLSLLLLLYPSIPLSYTDLRSRAQTVGSPRLKYWFHKEQWSSTSNSQLWLLKWSLGTTEKPWMNCGCGCPHSYWSMDSGDRSAQHTCCRLHSVLNEEFSRPHSQGTSHMDAHAVASKWKDVLSLLFQDPCTMRWKSSQQGKRSNLLWGRQRWCIFGLSRQN